MKPLVLIACCFVVACSGREGAGVGAERVPQGTRAAHDAPEAPHRTEGRVLLPKGEGRRGVELWVTFEDASGAPHSRWIRFDDDGRFEFEGAPTRVAVFAGSTEVLALEVGGLASLPSSAPGTLELGTLDARERLVERRLVVRRAGEPTLDHANEGVRVGMWSQPPPTDPWGGSVSLGSAQFPDRMLGEEQAWLVPRGAQDLHFLVELPQGAGRGLEWRSGQQVLFGPFAWDAVPSELVLE